MFIYNIWSQKHDITKMQYTRNKNNTDSIILNFNKF